MEKEKKQRKSGYSYLRAKIAKQEEEIAQLKAENKRLKEDSAYADANCGIMENNFTKWQKRALDLEKQLNTAIKQMGWLRRKIYHY